MLSPAIGKGRIVDSAFRLSGPVSSRSHQAFCRFVEPVTKSGLNIMHDGGVILPRNCHRRAKGAPFFCSALALLLLSTLPITLLGRLPVNGQVENHEESVPQ